MSRRLGLALALAALVASACAPGQTAQIKETPVAHASGSPSPSVSPSPVAPLLIVSSPLHAGELQHPYTTVALKATGGVLPYHWSVSDGALPIGLSLSDDGKVTGTPSATGSYLFTIRVDDSGGRSATLNSSIGVTKHITVTGICTTSAPCSVEAGCVTVCGVFGVLSGGVSPIKFKVTSGAAPTGMGIGAFALTKAFPAPSSAAGKDWVFTVTATDAIGATAKTTASFHVFPHIAFASPAPATPCALPCPFSTSYTLGTPNYQTPAAKATVTGTVTPMPAATASATSGTATVNVTKPATCPTGTKWTVSVVLTDASTCAANTYCATKPLVLTVICP